MTLRRNLLFFLLILATSTCKCIDLNEQDSRVCDKLIRKERGNEKYFQTFCVGEIGKQRNAFDLDFRLCCA